MSGECEKCGKNAMDCWGNFIPPHYPYEPQIILGDGEIKEMVKNASDEKLHMMAIFHAQNIYQKTKEVLFERLKEIRDGKELC